MGTPHLYQMTHWDINGHWYVNDVKNLAGRSAKWYVPMRILDLTVDDYISLLLRFHAQGIYYFEQTDYLNFYFVKEADARNFCSFVNKEARRKNYCCV